MADTSIATDASIDNPLSPSFRRGKNILAVASGKGGVGKTFVLDSPSRKLLPAPGKKFCCSMEILALPTSTCNWA
jgi:hypothetical protein